MRPRLHSFVLLCAAALTLGAAVAREPTKIEVAERSVLPTEKRYTSDATDQLSLTLVYFTEGAWPRDAVLVATRGAVDILKQCRVRVRQLEILRVTAPREYQYLDTPLSRELARTLQLSNPTVYFVTDTRQQPAFDAEAIGRANSSSRPELADTVWITRAARDVSVALAHELVHVLGNSGAHVDLPGNLMREETSSQNTHLTPAQCAQLRTAGTENGLLHRQP